MNLYCRLVLPQLTDYFDLCEQATGRTHHRPRKKIRSAIAVKTFSEWEDVAPGNLEIDFVAHCGGNLSGAFIHSLVATDVASRWTECVPILIREQSLVVATLDLQLKQFPFPIIGINTDNDSSFEYPSSLRQHEVQIWLSPNRQV